MSLKCDILEKELNDLLTPQNFHDYGPNGLQVKGKEDIKHIAFAVSATKESIAKAVTLKADALVVHHGLFWKFHGPKTITGAFYHRVAPLIKNDINLFGYHLPLDAHLEVGNAASLAHLLGLKGLTAFGEYKKAPLGVKGKLSKPLTAIEFKEVLESSLKHSVLHSSPDDQQKITTLGIITGGANNEWSEALNENLDAYLTGEMSEHNWHEAKESGVHMFAGGHHATEQGGVRALMQWIQKRHGDVKLTYIPSDNPA